MGNIRDAFGLGIQVRQALAELAYEERQVLVLVDLEGFAPSDAAGIVGISEESLSSRLHAARAAFQRRIGDRNSGAGSP
jgi:DNA-directed RNA polymerase specialized sigma24 family protein